MKSPRELVAQQELMADEIVKFVTEGRADEAIRRFPEHEPEIRALESLHRSSKDRNPQTNLQGATGYRSLQEMSDLVSEANACHREALMLSRIGDFSGAEKAFDRAILRAPSFAIAYMNRAILYVLTNRTAHAMRDFEEAARLAPQSARARDFLAQAKAGRWSAFKV